MRCATPQDNKGELYSPPMTHHALDAYARRFCRQWDPTFATPEVVAEVATFVKVIVRIQSRLLQQNQRAAVDKEDKAG